jgi:hypothetical protein
VVNKRTLARSNDGVWIGAGLDPPGCLNLGRAVEFCRAGNEILPADTDIRGHTGDDQADTTKAPSNRTGLKNRPATEYCSPKKLCTQGRRFESGSGPFQINLAQITAETIQKIAEALSWNPWPGSARQPCTAAKNAKTIDSGKKRVPIRRGYS